MQKESCPYCQGDKVIKWCKRKTENRGEVQRYKCKECERCFSIGQGFWKMKNNEHKVTASMDMYYSGMSLRKIQAHLKMFYPHNAHHSTIYRWIVKYANMIGKLTDNMQIKSGSELMADEMEYKRLGESHWFVDTIDTSTRFMVSGDFFKERSFENINSVLKNARMKTGTQIQQVTTDGLKVYPRVVRRNFNTHKLKTGGARAVHKIVRGDRDGFNIKIERMHNTIRDRTKIMRGFHGSLHSAKMIMKGLEIYYNYVRQHQGIRNKTPAEEAIPQLNLGLNKWLGLIRLASA